MTARLQMCQQKRFDAVEPDNMDGYANSTGFPLQASDQLAYNEWIAAEVHALGMAVLQKNDGDQAAALQPYFDGVLDEQCNEYSQCSSYAPYVSAGKPVLNAEYQASLSPGFCAGDAAQGIMGALYAVALDGSTLPPCFGPEHHDRLALRRDQLNLVPGRVWGAPPPPAPQSYSGGGLTRPAPPTNRAGFFAGRAPPGPGPPPAGVIRPFFCTPRAIRRMLV